MATIKLVIGALLINAAYGFGINLQYGDLPKIRAGSQLGGPNGFPENIFGSASEPKSIFGDFLGKGLHPLLKDLTLRQKRELLGIIGNQTLTKEEMKTQLQQWAEKNGGNLTEQLNEIEQKLQQIKEMLKEKKNEILKSATSLLENIDKVRDNMSLTVKQEIEQIRELMKQQPMSVANVAREVEAGALKAVLQSMKDQQPTEQPVTESSQ